MARRAGEGDDQDVRIDESEEESFPASDPPSNTPETGIHIDATKPVVIDNRAEHQFEIALDGEKAVLVYQRRPDSIVLAHTEVPPAFRGRHYADALAKAALDSARAEGLHAIVRCPFVEAYLKRHPQMATHVR
ncbi:MAG TPA: GNAT family N-acetyltransferase [Vicinamibacterales bacterium]|nr:GNAT family N-acetyltransferase [Vicinamibacterales bacterium]